MNSATGRWCGRRIIPLKGDRGFYIANQFILLFNDVANGVVVCDDLLITLTTDKFNIINT